MLIPGLVSVTFRQLDFGAIIDLARRNGLKGIEWGGDVHVPHGELDTARSVGDSTRGAGLQVAAYGSYFRLGGSEDEGLQYKDVLATASALHAPVLRVWAGACDFADADESYIGAVIDEARRCGDLAAERDVTLIFEFHNGTLNNTPESCEMLMRRIDHPAVRTYWQPRHGAGAALNCKGLRRITPWLAGLHVFHWWPTHEQRHPLSVGAEDWARYLDMARRVSGDLYALLEFVRDDAPGQLEFDARTLLRLIANDTHS